MLSQAYLRPFKAQCVPKKIVVECLRMRFDVSKTNIGDMRMILEYCLDSRKLARKNNYGLS